MRRYWAMRTDPARRDFIWSEVVAGRMRQGWGYRSDLDLELLAELRRKGVRLPTYQQDAWRGNRRLLPSEPDSMQVGDIVLLLNLPQPRRWSIVRVTGPYRYEISDHPNSDGQRDYGHIRDVELLTDRGGIDPDESDASDRLRRSLRPISRLWRIDDHGAEIEEIVVRSQTPRTRS